jgi:hypothetical protein
MKVYKIYIENEEFTLDLPTIRELLNEKSFKLWKKVNRQGGVLNLTINAVK